MNALEFSRTVKVRPQPPQQLTVTADAGERDALAARFGICGIDALTAELTFEPDGEALRVRGRMIADLVQTCAISGDDFPTRIDERLDLRFVPLGSIAPSEDEIELASDSPDDIEFEGKSFDLGEAVAQSLGLAIDPYAEGPGADQVRREAGIVDDSITRGPLADLLEGLKKT